MRKLLDRLSRSRGGRASHPSAAAADCPEPEPEPEPEPVPEKAACALHVVHAPPSTSSPSASGVDIIAIHGLGGHWQRSFTHPETGVFWLRDLLPSAALPRQQQRQQQQQQQQAVTDEHDGSDVRVYSFAWAADCPLAEAARSLVAAAAGLRDHHRKGEGEEGAPKRALDQRGQDTTPAAAGVEVEAEAGRRPIVWIAHSMGGPLLQGALASIAVASDPGDDNTPSPLPSVPTPTTAEAEVLARTAGILFFGVTPQLTRGLEALLATSSPSSPFPSSSSPSSSCPATTAARGRQQQQQQQQRTHADQRTDLAFLSRASPLFRSRVEAPLLRGGRCAWVSEAAAGGTHESITQRDEGKDEEDEDEDEDEGLGGKTRRRRRTGNITTTTTTTTTTTSSSSPSRPCRESSSSPPLRIRSSKTHGAMVRFPRAADRDYRAAAACVARMAAMGPCSSRSDVAREGGGQG